MCQSASLSDVTHGSGPMVRVVEVIVVVESEQVVPEEFGCVDLRTFRHL